MRSLSPPEQQYEPHESTATPEPEGSVVTTNNVEGAVNDSEDHQTETPPGEETVTIAEDPENPLTWNLSTKQEHWQLCDEATWKSDGDRIFTKIAAVQGLLTTHLIVSLWTLFLEFRKSQ